MTDEEVSIMDHTGIAAQAQTLAKSSSARVEWVDTLKFICILNVYISHTSIKPLTFLSLLSPFFLTSFFFASGYTHKHNRPFGQFLVRKIKTLLLPWFIYGLLCCVIFNSLLFGWSVFPYYLKCMYQQIPMQEVLWFFTCLFVAYIPFYFITKYTKKPVGLVITLLLAAISILSVKKFGNVMPWHIQTIGVAMFFMDLGYCFKDIEKKFDSLLKKYWFLPLIGLVYAIVIGVEWQLNWRYININAYPCSLPVWFATALLGMVLIIGIAKRLPSNPYYAYIGKNTLLCFAFLGVIFTAFNTLLSATGLDILIMSDSFLAALASIVLAVSESIVMIPVIWLIQKFLPFTLGKF